MSPIKYLIVHRGGKKKCHYFKISNIPTTELNNIRLWLFKEI